MDVDVSAYAGERVRIGFYHQALDYAGGVQGTDVSSGWYIDDVQVVTVPVVVPVLPYIDDFEAGSGDWGADNGLWEVGTPTAGPSDCHSGDNCAGTVLAGNYTPDADSRLISAPIQHPAVTIIE